MFKSLLHKLMTGKFLYRIWICRHCPQPRRNTRGSPHEHTQNQRSRDRAVPNGETRGGDRLDINHAGDARTKRDGEAGTFFRDVLETKLAAFNPWMSTDIVRSVVETLDALPATIEGNRELLAWLRGERQWYDDSEKRHRPVTLINFTHVADNLFHVTWE